MSKKRLLGTLAGNVIVFFDFTVYAYSASNIAKSLMPNNANSLLWVYILHAISFFVRPLGALVYGWIGDKYGRNKSLKISIVSISICTLGIGIIPSYASIGIASAVLLVIMRIAQGCSVSGEEGNALTYLYEDLNESKPGNAGALVLATVVLGTLLGSIVHYLVCKFLGYFTWSWRIPFLLAMPMGLLSLFLRRNLHETADFEACRENKQILPNPIIGLFKNYYVKVLHVILYGSLFSAMTSLIIVFLPNYAIANNVIPKERVFLYLSMALLTLTIMLPLVGKLANIMGERKCFTLGCVGTMLFILPIYNNIISSKGIIYCFYLICLITLTALVSAPLFALVAKSFPVNVRSTGSSFCINTSVALFSGTTPIVAYRLIEYTGDSNSPALWILALAIATLVALLTSSPQRGTSKVKIEEIRSGI